VITVLALAALGYLVGSVPTGVLAGRLRGVDPREVGSGRIGAANTYRALGLAGAALVALGDLSKGLVMALLALHFAGGALAVGVVGVATVMGQVWSIFLLARAGRGVATSAGVALAFAPLAAAAAAVVLFGLIKLTRITSLASLSSAVVLVGLVALTTRDPGWTLLAAVLCVIVWLTHLDNLRRLLAGTERRV